MCALMLLTGCDAVDRARSRLAAPDAPVVGATGSGLALGLQTPGVLDAGEEGTVRLTVTNSNDTTVSNVTMELILPGWAEPLPPRVGDPEVGMMALEDGGTRFTYRLNEPPLDAGSTRSVEQRVRVPPRGTPADGALPWSRIVRARLLRADGQVLAEVESEIGVAGAVGDTASTTGAAFSSGEVADRLGAVRLGMTATSLRQAVPATRDTVWTQEGLQQRGIVSPLEGGGQAIATLSGDSVSRIEVRDPAVRNRHRLGVGSTLDELRSAYGTVCADAAEGTVVVWSPQAPGMSFALDAPVPQNPAQLRQNSGQLPGSARVTRWWLRRGSDRC